jgi:hypothetical protein
MRRLAAAHKNEYREADPVQYGTTAGNPETWDADMLYGCLADEYGSLNGEYNISTFAGSGLDQLECPNGYDPRLIDAKYGSFQNYTQSREIQELHCHATGGYFTLSFRGYTTEVIYATDSLTAFERKLESLQVLSDAHIYSTTDTLCDETGLGYVNITFVSELGSGVPLLTVVENELTGWPMELTIRSVQHGTEMKLDECAGRGFCSEVTGRCACWDWYGSSDGGGGPGSRGDCGYRDIT